MPNIVFRIYCLHLFQGYYSKCYSQHWFLGKQFLTLHSELYSGSHAPKFSSHSHIVFKYYFPKMVCSQYNPQDNITLSPILFPNIILRRGFYIIFWDNIKVAFILYWNITPAVSLVEYYVYIFLLNGAKQLRTRIASNCRHQFGDFAIPVLAQLQVGSFLKYL